MIQQPFSNLTFIWKYLVQLLRLYLFWLLQFLFFRLVFVVFNYGLIKDSGANWLELLPMLWHALPLDISMASYIAAIAFLLLLLDFMVRIYVFRKIFHAFQYLLIILYALLSISEIALYPEWKMKVNAKALEYLANPTEVLSSNKTLDTLWQIALWAVLTLLMVKLYTLLVKKPWKKLNQTRVWWLALLLSLLSALFIFIGMRGGVQEIPISQSQSYYSKNDIVNDISVNSAWNLMHNIINTREINNVNLFKSMDATLAKREVMDMHRVAKDTTISLINIPKPNILFIILESWSADMIYSIGKREGATPEFQKLMKEGLFFSKIYSSGNRSQQGLASILGGFPAIPITTLTTSPEKMRQTATITSKLNKAGYYTAFYYGGELRYGNIKAYLLHNKFQEIMEETDWDYSIPRGKLGIHDGFMFSLLQQKLANIPKPFFVNYFTLSSHSPYDQPMKKQIDWKDSEDDFHNSVYYTDSCIGDFMAKAKKEAWYDNALIVLVADHSHQTFMHRSISTAAYRQIPMLILGGALKDDFKGINYDKVCSQTDIGTSLLKQLNMNTNDFPWSKNLMNPFTPEFAYYELNEGFGWVNSNGFLSYDHFGNRVIYTDIAQDSLRQEAQEKGAAYLQDIFQEFIDL